MASGLTRIALFRALFAIANVFSDLSAGDIAIFPASEGAILEVRGRSP
jgi:hypothetical protein